MHNKDTQLLQLIYEQQVAQQPMPVPPQQQQQQQSIPVPPQQQQPVQQPTKLTTWGDLQQLVEAVKQKLGKQASAVKRKEAAKTAGKVALNLATGGTFELLSQMSPAFVALVDNSPDLISFFKKVTRQPDDKKTGTFIDQLDVDDAFSQIVDDKIEVAFLKSVEAMIKSHQPNEPLPPNWNMTNELIKFLKQSYKASAAIQQHLLDLETKVKSNVSNATTQPVAGIQQQATQPAALQA